MNLDWFTDILLASATIGAAGLAADHLTSHLGRPRRWVWALAMASTLIVAAAGAYWPTQVPNPGLLRWISSTVWGPGDYVSLEISAPSISRSLPEVDRLEPVQGPGAEVDERRLPASADAALVLLWGLASFNLLLTLLVAAQRTSRARSSWRPSEIDGVPVLLSRSDGPAVVGMWNSAIVLPQWVTEASTEERRLILEHERQHLAAGDSRLLAIAAFVTAVMPLNPLLWWMRRRLQEAVETDCDARVLAGNADVRAYAEVLLLAAGSRVNPGLSLALARRPSTLERRFRMMTMRRTRRPRLLAASLVTVTAGFLLVGLEMVAQEPGATASIAADSPVRSVSRLSAAEAPPEGRTLPESESAKPPPAMGPATPGIVTRAVARQGTLTGRVRDSQTGTALAEAHVFIQGIGLGTLTDDGGRYTISEVPPGSHTVTVALPGYRTDLQPRILIDEGQTTVLSHELTEQAVAIGSLLISATSEAVFRARPATQPAIYVDGRLVQPGAVAPRFIPATVTTDPALVNWQELARSIQESAPVGGELVVWAYIGTDGAVRNVRIVESSGSPELDEVVETGIREVARFTPARNRGQGRAVWVHLPVTVEMD